MARAESSRTPGPPEARGPAVERDMEEDREVRVRRAEESGRSEMSGSAEPSAGVSKSCSICGVGRTDELFVGQMGVETRGRRRKREKREGS